MFNFLNPLDETSSSTVQSAYLYTIIKYYTMVYWFLSFSLSGLLSCMRLA
eukprot:m.16371 g.16371  ORF g.16371 m.16371 type:complete len:50 (+) comp26871_c0_seq4:1825-1974(+)